MNQLQRLKTLFLVLIITAPAISRANAETPDVMALATLDRFMIRISKPGPQLCTTPMFGSPAAE
jgi:hypothetical protein